jgi:hypothetical protein
MSQARSVDAQFTLNQYTLDVTKSGTGSGSVSSTPPGISCGSDCSENFAFNTVVTLTAAANTGSSFVQWTGACTGSGDCVVTMSAARSVDAEFSLNQYTLDVTRSGTGSGSVSSTPSGISCSPDCSENFDYSTVVTLTATADYGSVFSGWSGACMGFGDCVVTLNEAKSVNAEFTLGLYVLSVGKSGTGSGMVLSNPSGIDCGSDCNEDFDYNTVVTLTATANWLSTFKGWSGAGCSGTDDCVVTMNEAKSVTAEFMTYFIYLPLLFK